MFVPPTDQLLLNTPLQDAGLCVRDAGKLSPDHRRLAFDTAKGGFYCRQMFRSFSSGFLCCCMDSRPCG